MGYRVRFIIIIGEKSQLTNLQTVVNKNMELDKFLIQRKNLGTKNLLLSKYCMAQRLQP